MELVETYKVNLPHFEGPLDLLLYLIKKNDLDIYDIPISFITDEYLKFLDRMEGLNIDLAGEFLMMASELAHIKSRLLLPSEGEGEEEEGPDPRAELARRLMEYQRFKLAAQTLLQRKMLGRDLFTHSPAKTELEESELPLEGDVYKLIGAFEKILKRFPKENYHPVQADRLSISQRIYQMLDVLAAKEVVLLEELLPDPLTRYDVVITFLALLEMAKLKMIAVEQEVLFGTLTLRRIMKLEEDYGEKPIRLDS